MAIDGKSERDKMYQEVSNAKREAGIRYLGRYSKSADAEWEHQMALMPRDTRDLTGRLMGDPIPGDPRRLLASGGKNDCKN